ncbi:heterokaryon incompatibility protein-domain-containing protein [Cercophora samala]|uniref:Heterokaryon incompatibility protein-domain-containing protein n=1 Tax=Cercophora samala TaxID=330535 RepID=A0AA39ZCM7_9PEZI|nr:heterokaryon incompatibility protein-domain-containing protein [Cercophora samala]
MEAKEDDPASKCDSTPLPDPLPTSEAVFLPPKHSSQVYRSLPNGHIRLLRIHPDPSIFNTIKCSIFEYPILRAQRTGLYEALSYAWGSPPLGETPPSVLVDGCKFIVGENLHAALLSLRDPWIDRIFWIDAICINQSDEDEKGHQVEYMARIYARARAVVVWLGFATERSGRAMRTIQSLAMLQDNEEKREKYRNMAMAMMSRRSAPSENDDGWNIGELLQRPWFKRIWVVQEVAAARHIVIKCGRDEVSGQAFCAGIEIVMQTWPQIYQDWEAPFVRTLIEPTIRLMKDADRKPRHAEDVSSRFSLNIGPLRHLIDMYRHREATDRRDKIYALLGMCSDDPGAAGLLPDYSIAWPVLIQQLARSILKLAHPVVIDAWDNRDSVMIKGRSYVLGEIAPNHVAWNLKRMSLCWSVGAKQCGWHKLNPAFLEFNDLLEGDVLLMLDGARMPLIARHQNNYWTVVRIAADMEPPEKGSVPPGSQLMDIILIWDWGPVAGSPAPELPGKLGVEQFMLKLANFNGQLKRPLNLSTDGVCFPIGKRVR